MSAESVKVGDFVAVDWPDAPERIRGKKGRVVRMLPFAGEAGVHFTDKTEDWVRVEFLRVLPKNDQREVGS